MCRKNKCISVVLVGMVLLCLLSACTVNGNGTDMESQKANDSAEHELSSEDLLSETDSAGLQVTENISDEQSSSTVGQQDENMSSGMEDMYKAILLGEEDFINVDHKEEDRKINIENIKKVVTDEDRITARVKKFTIIDLDGNGENEIVLWIEVIDGSDFGFEILFYKDQEVCGVTLPYRALLELKTDGTFSYSGGMEDSGIGRLQLSERGYTIEDASDSGSQVGKTSVEWYDLTPDNVESVLK